MADRIAECVVEAAHDGARLDRALEALVPGSGLRERRRLIEGGRVLVEGRKAPAGLKVRAGQRLALLPREEEPAPPPVPVIAAAGGYAALNKPAGLHSASLAGGGGQSVEAMLPALFPGKTARLLNRLDFLTSGIVLAALSPGAAKAFARLAPGQVLKEYLAMVRGELAEPLELMRALDTDDRRRTRVLGKLDRDPRNWTLVWPEAALPGGLTLVRVRIQAGARHQIRAHLAAANLPIVGDPLYGEPLQESGEQGEGLRLHHRLMEFPGFSARCEPAWLPSQEASPRAPNANR